MKALILNSGLGSRMGDKTKYQPKCMTELYLNETIISRQLKLLKNNGITEIIITTGPFEDILKKYIDELNLGLDIIYIHNPLYKETNYIYSIFLAKERLEDDILLLHGDLVFTDEVIKTLLNQKNSSVIIDSTSLLPEKDFKAVIVDGKVLAIGVEYTKQAVACQPIYYLLKEDWKKWMNQISAFCKQKITGCYAEKALNEVIEKIYLKPIDVKGDLCKEIDCEEDLQLIKELLE